MSGVNRKRPVFDPGLCRCCGTMKKCRVLNVEYEGFGQKEVYSDMIMDCFGLLMSHLDGKLSERLICATCVTRIRDALSFRRQVLSCEEAFLRMKIYDASSEQIVSAEGQTENTLVECPSKIEIEVVKSEPPDEDEHASDGGSHCGDALADQPDDYKPSSLDQDSSNDDLPLRRHIESREKISPTVKPSKDHQSKRISPATFSRQIATTKNCKPQSMDQEPSSDDVPLKRLVRPLPGPNKPLGLKRLEAARHNGPAGLARQMMITRQKLPMSKVQQMMRERDPTYMTETNILTIVEFSHVCPFKCRHNHLLCYYCGETFSDPKLLREHTQTSHDPKKFKVTEHKNMIKIDLTRIDCRLCSVKIDNLDEFKKHIAGVHEKKYYFDYKDSVLPFKLTSGELKCAICMVIFPYFHALNKHMNEHFSNYVCETCGLGFVDKGRFVMHQQRHEEGDFPCETCGKVFKAAYNRDLHIDRVHKKRGRVYCPKCDVKLMSYPQKLKHLVEVHGEAPLSFPCDMCDKVCETRRTLTIHRRKDHLKDYRYECQCCGQKFFTRFALNNHMPTHTGERNYKCKVCEKCYPRRKTLKDHMRIHTNDRRYRCHVCGQAFIQNCSLKGHVKSQHPEYG